MTPEELEAAKAKLAELETQESQLREKSHETTAAARKLNELNRALIDQIKSVKKERDRLAHDIRHAENEINRKKREGENA